MPQFFMAILIGLAFVAFAASVIYSAMRLMGEVPDEDREFLDPLPKWLRLIWPLLRAVDYYLASTCRANGWPAPQNRRLCRAPFT